MSLKLTYVKLRPFEVCLFVEAASGLTLALIQVKMASWRQKRPNFGMLSNGMTISLSTEQMHTARFVGIAVARAARYLPFETTCLMRGLAAKTMLSRRGVATMLHLGVSLDPSIADKAHAWLEAGPLIVTGKEARSYYVSVASFL